MKVLLSLVALCGAGAAAVAIPSLAERTESSSTGKLQWFGVDESCAEWGALPGTYGVDYTFPNTQTIGQLISKGFNIFRVPFAMERMAVGSMTNSLDPGYLQNYSSVIQAITNGGAHAIVDAHNYGRYYNNVITDTNAFGTFWTNVATAFKDDSKVIFDINNEYNTMEESLVFDLNQAGITGIRNAGATSQYIFAEGNGWTSAAGWNTTNDSLKDLSDPSNMLIYEMHQYLDSNGSGENDQCVSTTIGVERVEGATQWLRDNNKLGVIGETAGGPNQVCQSAVTGMLDHLQANSDVWLGAVWWSAGPWWPIGDTSTGWANYEPPNGEAYTYYNSILAQYLP